MLFEFEEHGNNLNKISEGMTKAVEERMKSERFKTELITNVSHDIKTPLTSIINYVDLLEKEELNNDKATEYLEVLDRQSSKLKKLIEDLVEASKASSGNLPVNLEKLDVGVFLTQTVGEFEEKLSIAGIELIIKKPEEPVFIMADGRHLWRIVDNLMNNICKYAQPQSRVYVNLEADANVRITFRNISKYQLNVTGDELMERFVRGDKSRNTEGHGLGLSIAQSLVTLISGKMEIVVDGDLFKVVIEFDKVEY
jgi:signal transduction histidine kinase